MPRANVIGAGLPASDPLARGAYANATLTAITGAGAPDRTGDPAAGPVLWSGEARGYLTRERHTVITGGQRATGGAPGVAAFSSGGEQMMVNLDVFQLPRTVDAPILEVAGPDWTATTVTIVDHRDPGGGVTLTARVYAMELRAAGTLLDHIRLELQDVSAG